MSEEKPNEETTTMSFKDFMDHMAKELDQAFNPTGEKKIGFYLAAFDATGNPEKAGTAVSNCNHEIVYNFLKVYQAQLGVKLNKQSRKENLIIMPRSR